MQRNTFQGVLITDHNTSYAVFTYKCGELVTISSDVITKIGYFAGSQMFTFHRVRGSNISCVNSPALNWTNLVYKLSGENIQPDPPRDECSLSTYHCEGTCSNTDEFYKCSCPSGYSLDCNAYTCSLDCSVYAETQTGYFETPDFYDFALSQQNFQCQWIIDVSMYNSFNGINILQLSFNPKHRGRLGTSICSTDYLTMYDVSITANTEKSKLLGRMVSPNNSYELDQTIASTNLLDQTVSTETELGRHCFTNAAKSIFIRSQQAMVLVHGTSNSLANQIGAEVSYKLFKCGGHQNESWFGDFSSPGWPNRYPGFDLRCEWIIELPSPLFGINLATIGRFGINGRYPCPTDYIEIFDGADTSARSLGRFCKFDRPMLTTSTNKARIVFQGSSKPRRPVSRVGAHIAYSPAFKGLRTHLALKNWLI